uniref:Uncharacterized protein n=1 Tax=Octopus bimaculoides TaxID=37653 RepID=A0A0L8G9W4_OCTBM
MLSSLRYGAEIWAVLKAQVDKLYAYMMRRLRRIMNIILFEKTRNQENLWHGCLPPLMEIFIERTLQCSGHVRRVKTKNSQDKSFTSNYTKEKETMEDQDRDSKKLKKEYEVERD